MRTEDGVCAMQAAEANPDGTDFETQFAHYVQAVACKTIGDAGQYTKHLQRRAAEGDAAAVAQTAALGFFAGLEGEVQTAIQELRMLGQERIVRVCDAICQETPPPFAQVRWWGICALSGTPSNCNIQVGHGESAVLLAPEFEAFATALWLVQNMNVVEKSRAAAFANGAATAGVGGTYKWAFGVVRETIAATRARLDEYLREVARVQGAV
jgi:hypothetical protein